MTIGILVARPDETLDILDTLETFVDFAAGGSCSESGSGSVCGSGNESGCVCCGSGSPSEVGKLVEEIGRDVLLSGVCDSVDGVVVFVVGGYAAATLVLVF